MTNSTQKMTRAERRRMKKATAAFEHHGCARCGTKQAPASYAMLATDKIICRGCYRHGDRVIGFMAETVLAGSDAQADDRDWFAANPQASWRLRPIYPGEAEELYQREAALALQHGEPPPEILIPLDEITHALIAQVRPGARMRIPVVPPPVGPTRDAWVQRHVADLLERGVAALPLNEALAPTDRFLALNAAALLPIDKALGGKIADHMRAQGQAMAEARGQSRH